MQAEFRIFLRAHVTITLNDGCLVQKFAVVKQNLLHEKVLHLKRYNKLLKRDTIMFCVETFFYRLAYERVRLRQKLAHSVQSIDD